MRLAVAYALLDCSRLIRQAHLEAALALWEYSERSAAWIFGIAMGDPVTDRILEALQTAPGRTMTREELSNHFNRHVKSERIGRSLAVLSTAGRVVIETVKTAGRSAEVVRLTARGKRGMRGIEEDTAHRALSAQQEGA